MSFKWNFLLWIVVEMLWFFGQIVFVEVLFQYVKTIGDWTKWEMVLLIGTHQIVSQLFQAFFYTNLVNLPEMVRTGKLDFLLIQPVDAQFAVSTKQFSFDSMINIIVGLVVVGLSLAKLDFVPSVANVLLYFATILIGVAIHYSIMFMLTTASFWIVRAQGLVHGYYNLFNIARYPASVFHGAFKFIFSWIIPVIIVANIPAQTLLNKAHDPWRFIAQLVAAALIIITLSRLLWRSALRRYSSASS